MYGDEPQDVLYYLTLYNENYAMPARPEWVTDEDIVRRPLPLPPAPEASTATAARRSRATLLAGGSIMQQALRAQQHAGRAFGVAADVWSAPSYQLLRNEALEAERWNRLHPDAAAARAARHASCCASRRSRARSSPSATSSRAWPDLVARWVPGGWWRTLGTDGFGRSDTREALRRFFEIDAESIVATDARRAGALRPDRRQRRARQIEELGLDPEASFALNS